MNRFTKILKTRKGFTLMEIIVVMIILAILAAALIPSFVNWVQMSRGRAFIPEARVGMTAAQTILTEAIGNGTFNTTTGDINALVFTAQRTQFRDLVRADITATNEDANFGFSAATFSGNRVTGIQYIVVHGANQWTIIINPTGTTVTRANAP
jgi:type IV pilus assembly protein PilA